MKSCGSNRSHSWGAYGQYTSWSLYDWWVINTHLLTLRTQKLSDACSQQWKKKSLIWITHHTYQKHTGSAKIINVTAGVIFNISQLFCFDAFNLLHWCQKYRVKQQKSKRQRGEPIGRARPLGDTSVYITGTVKLSCATKQTLPLHPPPSFWSKQSSMSCFPVNISEYLFTHL